MVFGDTSESLDEVISPRFLFVCTLNLNIWTAYQDSLKLQLETMKKINLIGLLVICLLTSCASYQKTAPIMGIHSNNINTHVAAVLDYDNIQRVEGEVQSKKIFWVIPLTKNNKTLKNSNRYSDLSSDESKALAKAKENGNFDIILEPEFEKEKHSYFFGIFKKSKTKVRGWGVNIKGFKEDASNAATNQQLSTPKGGFLKF